MTACNARLTTATVTPCDCGCDKRHPENVTLHTLTCESRHNNPNELVELHYWMSDISQVKWDDDTPGATLHTPTSTVTDSEFKAASNAFYDHLEVHAGATNGALDAALEAAAAVRAAQEDDRD